jgi:hypothetical protein
MHEINPIEELVSELSKAVARAGMTETLNLVAGDIVAYEGQWWRVDSWEADGCVVAIGLTHGRHGDEIVVQAYKSVKWRLNT